MLICLWVSLDFKYDPLVRVRGRYKKDWIQKIPNNFCLIWLEMQAKFDSLKKTSCKTKLKSWVQNQEP